LPAKLAWRLFGKRQYARQARELRAPVIAGV
jgi:hypothetical protein